MARYSPFDIVIEIVELSRELISDIRRALVYYRASVYKHETADGIKKQIDELRLIASLIGDDSIQEVFQDFEVIKEADFNSVLQGECSFSLRTTNLIQALEKCLFHIQENACNRVPGTAAKFAVHSVEQHRYKLLSLCRHGSRQWSFFQSL